MPRIAQTDAIMWNESKYDYPYPPSMTRKEADDIAQRLLEAEQVEKETQSQQNELDKGVHTFVEMMEGMSRTFHSRAVEPREDVEYSEWLLDVSTNLKDIADLFSLGTPAPLGAITSATRIVQSVYANEVSFDYESAKAHAYWQAVLMLQQLKLI